MQRTRFAVRQGALAILTLLVLLVLLLPLAPRLARAQATTTADSVVYARALALVSAGDGQAGRAVVDSQLARIPTSSPRYAEGLFWRATLASNALDAERDYRRIAVEYELSPRVPAALTRLAQLELARGDRVLARQHLERLLHEYPPRGERASAWYWLGRIAFESGEAARGCMAIDSARALATDGDVELTNQIASEARRCGTRAEGSLASTAPAPVAPAAVPPETRKEAVAPPAVSRTRASGELTIQVAAYPTRGAAERARKRLTAEGFAARVVPAGRYYRVRVGRYQSRAAAAPVVKKLKKLHNAPIIVDAEPRP